MAPASIEDILAKSGLTELTGGYALWRIDIHDCEYPMKDGLSEQAAAYLVRYYTDLGHHQTYESRPWDGKPVELMPPVPLP